MTQWAATFPALGRSSASAIWPLEGRCSPKSIFSYSQLTKFPLPLQCVYWWHSISLYRSHITKPNLKSNNGNCDHTCDEWFLPWRILWSSQHLVDWWIVSPQFLVANSRHAFAYLDLPWSVFNLKQHSSMVYFLCCLILFGAPRGGPEARKTQRNKKKKEKTSTQETL